MTHWKFLDEQDGHLRSRSGDHTWKIGEWYKLDGPVRACRYGFHCSPKIWEAFSYVPGSVLAEVEVHGTPDGLGDKAAYPEMRIVRAWKFTREDSVALAIYAAELVLENFEREFPEDDRPRKAIEAAKGYLAASSESAAWSAAESAASAAQSAAWSAAESAESAESAQSAARSAAESAARSAESAARSAQSAAQSAARSAAQSAARSARFAAESDLLAKIEEWFQQRLSRLESI